MRKNSLITRCLEMAIVVGRTMALKDVHILI